MTPWALARQALLSTEFSRQEYWSGLPFPTPGYLPNKGIEPVSPALVGGFFAIEQPGKPLRNVHHCAIETEMEGLPWLIRNLPYTRWSQIEFLKEVMDELTPASQVEGDGGQI